MSPKTAAKSKPASAKTADKTGATQSESPNYTPTHALLALWSLEKKEGKAVSKGKLSKYKSLIEELVKDKAIEVNEGKRYSYLSIAESGKQSLIQGLQAADFNFGGTIASSREVNDALELLRQHSNGSVSIAETNGKAVETIASYDEFKQVALALFEDLNKGYNYGGLVPIWHIRRELSDRIGREEFNNWMMEMQAEQVFYLQTGEAREATEDQKKDSITNEIRGLLFFASKP